MRKEEREREGSKEGKGRNCVREFHAPLPAAGALGSLGSGQGSRRVPAAAAAPDFGCTLTWSFSSLKLLPYMKQPRLDACPCRST